MARLPNPSEGILLTRFLVSDDVERSRRFYAEALGGEAVLEGEPSIVALGNSWIIINAGGGPTEDKPTVTLEAPPDPDQTSSFLNVLSFLNIRLPTSQRSMSDGASAEQRS
jgi:hypothetical protein